MSISSNLKGSGTNSSVGARIHVGSMLQQEVKGGLVASAGGLVNGLPTVAVLGRECSRIVSSNSLRTIVLTVRRFMSIPPLRDQPWPGTRP